MSCESPEQSRSGWGLLPLRIVAACSGLPPDELERWRRRGVLPATAERPDGDGRGASGGQYTWAEHQRAVAAAKLLELGVGAERLPDAMHRLDEACEHWPITLLPELLERALPSGVEAWRFRAERTYEGALGRLREYGDVVRMEHDKLGGMPTVCGRRIGTAMLAGEYDGGGTVEEIAREYWITPAEVNRAVQFERAVDEFWPADAPAAG